MFQEKYNNSSYWMDIHKNFAGTLRAVGWPNLSEEFNKLKYLSESNSFLALMDQVIEDKKACEILEVGVGIGFWTAMKYEYGRKKGVSMNITALDISPAALAEVKEKFPAINILEADLKSVDVDANRGQYDLVTAIMVLLHLTDIESYFHSLDFCANSVKEGGYFILYEPLLNKHYSPFISIEYETFTGNSIPREFNAVDNILQNRGLKKCVVIPGASWLLNSPIQANSKLAYKFKSAVWILLAKLMYGDDKLTRIFSKILLSFDRVLKGKDSDSGTFVLYKKKMGANA